MSTFNVTSSSLSNQYEYADTNVTVNGNYVKDATTDTLQSVSGSVYHLPAQQGQQGEYIGNFNGYMRNGKMKYSTSEMSREDANMVWDAIDEIEANIIGTNQEEA